MNKLLELLSKVFGLEQDNILLDARQEFRLNQKEKILIKKYCEFKNITASDFFRRLAMKEINNFINENI